MNTNVKKKSGYHGLSPFPVGANNKTTLKLQLEQSQSNQQISQDYASGLFSDCTGFGLYSLTNCGWLGGVLMEK